MKEYIVTLKKDTDYPAFWAEMDQAGHDGDLIPERAVEVVDTRDPYPRKRHYLLEDAEAVALAQDPRVESVELPVEQDPRIKIVPTRTQQTRNNFEKPSSANGDNVNWALARNSSLYNIYGTSANTSVGYGYFVDGTGVDIVIVDSGIEATHPEFQEVDSVTSRLQQIDWFTLSGVVGTMPAGFYEDYSGHGTHLAAVAAGKTYGWAKNAQIFSIKLAGMEGPSDPNPGLTWTQTADVILGWHQNKMNPASPYYTGRPTVVNFSFSYNLSIVGLYTLAGGSYRGDAWFGSDWSYATKGLTFANPPNCPARFSSVDSDIEDMISAGITCSITANGNGLKIDVPGGVDYDNTLGYIDGEFLINVAYMRGSSPYSANAIIVGGMDSTPFDANTDQKMASSSAGPGVDIFAAAANIVSACSNINNLDSGVYYWDGDYNQALMTGTSVGTAQIAGITSLYIQNNPTATPAQVKSWVVDTGTYTILNTGLDDDYGNSRSQWGGNAPVAFSNSQGPEIQTTANTWVNTANVLVKTDGSTWTTVEKIWTKVDGSTWKQIY